MPLRLDCPSCRAPLDVARRHRGRSIPCPMCRAAVEVPRTLHFREAVEDALRDRRTGNRAFLVALVATALCVATPVCAATWWWTSRRISIAVDQGRVPAEPLLAARVVAAVGCVSQVTFWLTLLR